MFDLTTGNVKRPFRERAPLSKVIAIAVHVVILVVLVVLPLLRASHSLPEISVPMMMAFVAPPPAPPPPPPPPAPTPAKAVRAAEAIEARPAAAPVEAPAGIAPETALVDMSAGVAGGVIGGVPGGVVGGVVGGIPAPPPPPPPPPPEPVRVGGRITAPTVVHQVNPEYPAVALAAGMEGLVILEAVVDTEGQVQSVKVLRSGGRFLDAAAVGALKQWRYSPLILNGTTPVPFVLTVTFSFNTRAAAAVAH